MGDEIHAVEDELSDWAAPLNSKFFLLPDSSIFPALALVSEWAMGQRYEQAAISPFLQVADYYLVAHA